MIIKSNTITIYGLSSYENLIENFIKDLHLEQIAFDIQLILTEAISNAYYHGNKQDETKPICLSYSFDGKVLTMEIKDSGCKDTKLQIPDEIKKKDILKHGGRGLFLIKCLCDNVHYKDNNLIIEKYIDL